MTLISSSRLTRTLASAIAAIAVLGCSQEPLAPTFSQIETPAAALQTTEYTPGTTYYGANNYIEYIAGNLPVIFTAPHDGDLTPAEIPARAIGDACGTAITTARDIGTAPLVRAIRTAFFNRTGKYPHIVINHLHRTRMDANRAIREAACGNPVAEQAWNDYHAFIDAAKAQVLAQHGKGWYTDMHGHGHDVDQLELGYELSATTLRRSDADLDASLTVEAASSFRVFSEQSPLSFSAVLRGPTALGTLFAAAGVPAVPSQQKPAPPSGEPYFNGGYNTDRHACSNGGMICGLQIESHYTGVRDNATSRANFSATLTSVYTEFLAQFGITIPAPPAPALGDTLVVQHDNAKNNSAFARFVTSTSNWTLGSHTGSYNKANFRLATASSTATNDGAEFQFYVSAPGSYTVETWWPSLSTRSTGVSYRVIEADGERLADLKLNQTTSGSRWNPLGTYRFSKVGWAKVFISRSLSTTGSLAADAVRITQVNNPPIAAMSHPATADEGSAVTFDGSASTDPDGDVLSHSWNFGNGDTRTGQQVSYRFPNEGTYTVTLTVKDRHGAQKSATGTVTVSNVAPVIATLRDSTVAQGATYDAAGSFTDPGTDTWTATVDYGEGAGVEPLALSGKSFALSHTYRRAGTFTVTVVVRDGASTATQTARVTVANVAPVIAELPATTLQEGETYAVAGSFTDPGTDTWTGTVSFGDEAAGAPSTPLTLSGKSFTLSHRYARAGRYPVTVTITDSDGATATRTTMVTVESVAPTVTPLAAATIVEAGTYAATGSFTDPGLDTWRATVDYGDGSPVAALPLGGVDGKTFALQHRYTRAGRYTVTVVVTEASGATGSATTTVTVENVAPMVAPLPTVPVKEGEDYAVTGSFTDPGTDRWTATVRYGNGSAEAPLALDGKSFALSHRYARYGSYPVTVKVTDSFGGTGTQTAVVTVQNVAPVFAALPAARIDAGDRWTATATFTDPGVNEWTATVDYGDGAGARAVPVSGKGIALAERYDRPGTYTVTLTVNDGEATATTTTTVTVLNVVPAIASLAQATIAEAGTYGATGSFSDRGIDSWTATVDYGDGSSVETLTLGGAEGKAFALSHRYARYGSYTLTVKVTDAYGGAATQTAVVTVDNVVPVVAPFAGATLLVGETYGSAGTFADPGENVWVATANYGDGSATAPLALDGKRFALSFRYTTAGAFKVAVMVRDGRDSAAQTATATVLNPVQGVAVLSDEVSALGIGGAGSQTDAGASGSASVTGPLTQGEVNALLTTLRAASQQGARGNAGAAILQLEAFVNQVAAYERSGRLGASDAARLTAYARRVITSFRV